MPIDMLNSAERLATKLAAFGNTLEADERQLLGAILRRASGEGNDVRPYSGEGLHYEEGVQRFLTQANTPSLGPSLGISFQQQDATKLGGSGDITRQY